MSCCGTSCRFYEYLVELNKRDSEKVITEVDSEEAPVNSAIIVEYLKALVKTDKISQYSQGGIVR